jgi:hypothetical protein
MVFASHFDKSKYLRAEDVKADKKLRIKSVTVENFDKDGGEDKKLVIWFTNEPCGLALNKTNNRTLRGAFGDDTDGWVGKVIVVFSSSTDFRGKQVPALRVRIPPPKQAAASPGNGAAPVVDDPELTPAPVKPPNNDDMNDDIPF